MVILIEKNHHNALVLIEELLQIFSGHSSF